MKEIAVFESHPPPPLLEWGGRWSYSIYLVHNSVVVAFMHIVRPMNALATWPFELAAILAVSYIFFCFVERPSHLLARFLGRYLAKQQGSGGTAKADVPA
jgi:peptidoglycan/LPS O-acetylase OafA/YrhL